MSFLHCCYPLSNDQIFYMVDLADWLVCVNINFIIMIIVISQCCILYTVFFWLTLCVFGSHI